MHRLVVLLLALGSLGVTCGPGAEPPEPDACGEPTAGSIASLEIGPENSNGQPFVPWAAADTAYVTAGEQGGAMVGVSLRVDGASPPGCLAQTTRLSYGGGETVELEVPVHTYEAGGGARTTRTLWLIFDGGYYARPGDTVEVTAEVGDMTASSVLTIVEDRHELVALTPLTAAPRVGDTIELLLDTVHRPAFRQLEAQVSTTDPAVLGVVPLHTSYEDQTSFTVEARGEGTAEVVVSYGDQELRAAVSVAPR